MLVHQRVAPPSWKSWKKCKRLRLWTAKYCKEAGGSKHKMVVGNIQQCRRVLIEHVERCRKCSMSHSAIVKCSEPRTMLWSKSTSQVPALTKMRYRCVTDVTRFFTFFSRRTCHVSSTAGNVWHLWIHTLYDTSVALWESWELSSWQDLSALKLGGSWGVELQEGTSALHGWEIWGKMATSYYSYLLMIYVHQLFIVFACLYISTCCGEQRRCDEPSVLPCNGMTSLWGHIWVCLKIVYP